MITEDGSMGFVYRPFQDETITDFRQKQTLNCSKSLQLHLYKFHLVLQKAIGRCH